MSRKKEIYIIDYSTKQILLIKKFNVNKSKGYINQKKIDPSLTKDELNKFITFDMESITDLDSLKKDGDMVLFDPIMITASDYFNKKNFQKVLKNNNNNLFLDETSTLSSTNHLHFSTRMEKIELLKAFFMQFIDNKYHKFVLYAHNLSSYDGILILESLYYLCEDNGFKLDPIIKDNRIISLKIRFGKTSQNRYRYYIEIHDSLLLLLSSLDKLSKSFLKDRPEFHKIKNEYLLECLLYDLHRKSYGDARFLIELQRYCEMDSISLAHVIKIFALNIFNKYKINIHKYPTISSLSIAIYSAHFLESDDLIPLISGQIYRDIKKSYQGGQCDVYRHYSNEKVYSYDYVSMYPTQMLNQYMPVGEITKFIGNPLLTGETLETLKDKLAFIKCSVYVDKSLNRPLYQTLVNINGQLRSVCATGTFLNQMVFVPELLEYEQKTNITIKKNYF